MVIGNIIGRLTNPELLKSTIIFSIGWIIFFLVLNVVQNNGSFNLTAESIIIVFLFALVYNIVISFFVPGRFR